MADFDGKVALVTGGGSGIGRAAAGLLAARGAAVMIGGIDPDEVSRAAAELGGTVRGMAADVTDAAAVERLVAATVSTFDGLDILVTAAGIQRYGTAADTSADEWDEVLAVNLTGAFLLAKYGIPELARAGGGTMVISGSANSVSADRRWAAYCATKGALLMLCKALALDHAGEGVRVNIVCPGSVTTPLHQRWLRDHAEGAYDDALAADMAAHPLGRLGTPEDVASAALFLSCDESSFITGSSLAVDGGVTA
jgi:NAD(P)-dependent dehydrogenase (short-subunit alcohol dehydrogenase family)